MKTINFNDGLFANGIKIKDAPLILEKIEIYDAIILTFQGGCSFIIEEPKE